MPSPPSPPDAIAVTRHPVEDDGAGRLATGVSFLAAAVTLLPSFGQYVALWEAQPYTHGYLVALATVWLIWRERSLFRGGGHGSWLAIGVAAALSAVWLVGTIADVRLVILTAVPFLLLLWAAAVYGWDVARRLLPFVGLFLLAAPLWGLLTIPLQALTVLVSGNAVRALGIPAVIDGDLVHIPAGSFLIESGCAGLNYLMAGLTVSALYAVAFLQGSRVRVAVIALAAALAMLGNWVRVTSLIVVGHAVSMDAAVINGPVAHMMHGWGIFSLALVGFFLVTGRLEAAGSRPPRLAAAVSSDGPRSGALALRPRLALWATCAVALGPIVYVAVGALPNRSPAPVTFDALDDSWDTASAAPRPYAWEPAFAGADDRSASAWRRGADSVLVDHVVFHEQHQGAELIGFTSRIAPDTAVVHQRLFGPLGPRRRIVNEAILRVGDQHILVWYWYRVAGVETQSPVYAKALELWSFATRMTTAELLALSARCRPESCEAAARSMAAFLEAA